jgi:hypothetical protein
MGKHESDPEPEDIRLSYVDGKVIIEDSSCDDYRKIILPLRAWQAFLRAKQNIRDS